MPSILLDGEMVSVGSAVAAQLRTFKAAGQIDPCMAVLLQRSFVLSLDVEVVKRSAFNLRVIRKKTPQANMPRNTPNINLPNAAATAAPVTRPTPNAPSRMFRPLSISLPPGDFAHNQFFTSVPFSSAPNSRMAHRSSGLGAPRSHSLFVASFWMPRGASKPSAGPEACLSAHRVKFLSSKSDSPSRYLGPSVAEKWNHARTARNLVSPQARELAALANPTLRLDGVQLTQVSPEVLVNANFAAPGNTY